MPLIADLVTPAPLIPPLLLVHAAATWIMVGLIWFVQIVHYPLLASVGQSSLRAYATEHTRRTTYIVAPTMLIEALAACAIAWIAFAAPAEHLRIPATINLALLATLWFSTFALQVPLHDRLQRTGEPAAIDRLVRSNWLRTATWTTRGVLAIVLLAMDRSATIPLSP
jgi:hypothetical protein